MKKREDLDLTTIVDQAVRSYLAEATDVPGAIDLLSPAALEQFKGVWIRPIYYAIPHLINALDETPAAEGEDTEADEHAKILASFKVPDSLDGLTA